MKRHHFVFLGTLGIMAALGAYGSQNNTELLLLEWAGKGAAESPPVTGEFPLAWSATFNSICFAV